MINLIFPVAGEAVRFGGTFKPFLKIGDKTFIEVTYEPFKKWQHKIKNIYFICTQEQEDAYNVTEEVEKLIKHSDVRVIKIPNKTSGPYQTIKQGIEIADIKGKSIVCDCDHTLNVDNIFKLLDKNYDAIIPTWNITKSEWKNWSKVIRDGNSIKMICEKERIESDELTVEGIIGCILFNSIENKFNSNNHKYVSNSLQSLLVGGKNIRCVNVTHANFYGDKIMLENFVNILRKQCTIFCDIDGVLVKHRAHSNQILSENKLLEGFDKLETWKDEGHKIILTTARSEKNRSTTTKLLDQLNIKYDKLVMGLPAGPRILINDHKPSKPFTNQSTGIEIIRNSGLKDKNINSIIESNDIKVKKHFEGGSFAQTYLINLNGHEKVRKHIIKSEENNIHYIKLVRQMNDLERLNFLWPGSTPKVIDKRDNDFDFYFDMDYLNDYKTISELDIDEQQVALNSLLEGMSDNVYSMSRGVDGILWLDNHFTNKIYSKFKNYRKHPILKTLIDSDYIYINKKRYNGLNKLLSKIDKHLIKPYSVRPIHGDFTFENVMWNGSDIKLIDMDGSDSFDAAELDLGKMCQSIFSRFNEWKNLDTIVNDVTGINFTCNDEFFNIKQDSIYNLMIEKWKLILHDNEETVRKKGIFYMCMYFIRFVPFRLKQSEEHGIFALIMAIVWLSKLLGEENE